MCETPTWKEIRRVSNDIPAVKAVGTCFYMTCVVLVMLAYLLILYGVIHYKFGHELDKLV